MGLQEIERVSITSLSLTIKHFSSAAKSFITWILLAPLYLHKLLLLILINYYYWFCYFYRNIQKIITYELTILLKEPLFYFLSNELSLQYKRSFI